MPIHKKQLTITELEQMIREEYHSPTNRLSYMQIIEKYRSEYRSDYNQSEFVKAIKKVSYKEPAPTELIKEAKIKTIQTEIPLEKNKIFHTKFF